jgi:hypothetical protein
MSGLIQFDGARGTDVRKTFERAMAHIDECDGVVILMQRREAGLLWFAPDTMRLETLIFYCWSALTAFGMMASGIKL